MKTLIANIVISYLVTLGALLVTFSIMDVDTPLHETLIIGVILTAVSVLLARFWKGDDAWTLPASAPSSTNEIASTATS